MIYFLKIYLNINNLIFFLILIIYELFFRCEDNMIVKGE